MNEMMIYSNKKETFQIIDYTATHAQLLLRSIKSSEREYNIDIILKGVSHLILPNEINGFQISVLDNEEIIRFLQEKFSFDVEYGNQIFIIKDNEEKEYFVNALCFGIYHNTLDILETSLGRYDFESFGELQKWYAD